MYEKDFGIELYIGRYINNVSSLDHLIELLDIEAIDVYDNHDCDIAIDLTINGAPFGRGIFTLQLNLEGTLFFNNRISRIINALEAEIFKGIKDQLVVLFKECFSVDLVVNDNAKHSFDYMCSSTPDNNLKLDTIYKIKIYPDRVNYFDSRYPVEIIYNEGHAQFLHDMPYAQDVRIMLKAFNENASLENFNRMIESSDIMIDYFINYDLSCRLDSLVSQISRTIIEKVYQKYV